MIFPISYSQHQKGQLKHSLATKKASRMIRDAFVILLGAKPSYVSLNESVSGLPVGADAHDVLETIEIAAVTRSTLSGVFHAAH